MCGKDAQPRLTKMTSVNERTREPLWQAGQELHGGQADSGVWDKPRPPCGHLIGPVSTAECEWMRDRWMVLCLGPERVIPSLLDNESPNALEREFGLQVVRQSVVVA